ncbi:MAG: D-glycero-beta-D-manno-heptose-7-phosphate kinase [Acidobacteria bacterium]|nr:D-glycero-beta-D-manno-heptose-7-phosphate kinase [Acidobacteriota bacterium]
MRKERFEKIAARFSGKRVLVAGDVMLDEFVYGEVCRISPEAPIPVLEVREETFHLGGAANVARNILALGASPLLVGVIGGDGDSARVLQEMRELKMECGGLVLSAGRKTTKKTRIIARTQQVCRADREDRTPLSRDEQRAIASLLAIHIPQSDGVVVSDYAKGMITRETFSLIASICRRHKKLLVVDPKLKNFLLYRDATVITPNQGEAEIAARVEIVDEESLARAGQKLLKITRVPAVLVTRGKEGMSLFEAGRRPRHISTVAREVFDVTGAGDTVVAALALAALSGASLAEAADIANHAAGVAVGKLGTATASIDEILATL